MIGTQLQIGIITQGFPLCVLSTLCVFHT